MPVKTILLFLIAGVAEIGGAYLIWQWVRASKPAAFGILGVAALFAYGLIQTQQVFGFGRTFAAYGGVFITLAMLWGWLAEGRVPDGWDWLGVAVCLIGVGIILWAPRG